MRRVDLQKLSDAKFEDALLLFNNRRFSNAYYLAGYSIETALKACISKQISTDTIPDMGWIKAIYTHDFAQLVGLAGLKKEHQKIMADKEFAGNWAIVSEWKPEFRYTSTDPYSAQLMLEAIGNPDKGVLQWIKQYW